MMKEKQVSLQIPFDDTSIILFTPRDGVRVKSFCDDATVPFINQVKELALVLRFSKNKGFPFEMTVSFPGEYFAMTRQAVVLFKQYPSSERLNKNKQVMVFIRFIWSVLSNERRGNIFFEWNFFL